jgi:hypothetical protein
MDSTLNKPVLHELDDLGNAAAIKVGPPAYGGGTSLMAGGVVDHGTYLVQVTLTQAQGLDEATLAKIAEKVLRLADANAS